MASKYFDHVEMDVNISNSSQQFQTGLYILKFLAWKIKPHINKCHCILSNLGG